ncbi:MAG: DUF3037 domain-containing protein [Sandaracinaceae bacterium]|nr:DUF3037 domain-containing protein [Sandaracinaceae bacterium]
MRSACQAIVIRYAPDPSGGEVLNIGVVLLAPAAGFFGARFVDSWSRITGAFPEADIVHLRRIASAVESTCAAHADAQLSLEPQQDVVKAFEQIVPVEDASLAHSAAVSGVTSDPQRTLDELFARYVQPKARRTERESRPDHAVWRGIEPVLRSFGVLGRLTSLTLKSKHYEERFDAAWKNSRWNVAGPLSLDLIDPQRIVQKAASWTGRIISLEPSRQSTNVHLVVGLPPQSAPADVVQASLDGVGILRDQLEGRDLAAIVLESDADKLANRIREDLEHTEDE